MSYKVGQYQKDNNINYITENLTALYNKLCIDNTIQYSVDTNIDNFKQGKNFYLKILLNDVNNSQVKITIKDNEDNEQIIGFFRINFNQTIDVTTEIKIKKIAFIIIEFDTSNEITEDNIISTQIYSVYNVLNDINEVAVFHKFGIQGEPFQLINLNGNQIRLNNTGLFEINLTDINITFIGIILRNSSVNFYIDYQYE